ncbi:Shedu anti-phage system protein SduA domain-containing protein [Thalassobellus citreus]|uniref:Shedu anti-phage system protein SduA domain-containing protein n=1 Tax=Thalassobellus citreus TaxID=3367752 RepID=UPI00379D731F
MLYNRDYRELTEKEQTELKNAELYFDKVKVDGLSVSELYKYHELLPTASYHYKSLFPNHYLNITKLKDTEYLKKLGNQFKELIDTNPNERNILNFINKDNNFNIIASLFHTGYGFGHHKAFLFKEFELTSTFRADYLLIGKSSGGYNFIFVEIENPCGQITLKNGEFGSTFRKGIKQVEDWDSWIEGNFNSLKLIFNKFKSPIKSLPDEFLTLDKSRINYVVIAGRRTDFKDKTYELKRKYLKRNNIKILHYDNLIDSFNFLKIAKNY